MDGQAKLFRIERVRVSTYIRRERCKKFKPNDQTVHGSKRERDRKLVWKTIKNR